MAHAARRGMLTFSYVLHLDPVFFGVPVCLSADLEEAAAVQQRSALAAVKFAQRCQRALQSALK